MEVKSRERESALRKVADERSSFPRVAVVRRLDTSRPGRAWSLLLPPRFLAGSGQKEAPRAVPTPPNSGLAAPVRQQHGREVELAADRIIPERDTGIAASARPQFLSAGDSHTTGCVLSGLNVERASR